MLTELPGVVDDQRRRKPACSQQRNLRVPLALLLMPAPRALGRRREDRCSCRSCGKRDSLRLRAQQLPRGMIIPAPRALVANVVDRCSCRSSQEGILVAP